MSKSRKELQDEIETLHDSLMKEDYKWRKATRENATLRAMLPSSVEVLPTEPGWYWTRRRNGEWVLMEVYMGWSKQLLATVDGREHAEPIREFRSLAPFYGPLVPPDISSGAGKKVEVNE